MPGINMSVAHSLKQAEAVKRIRKLVEELKAEYSDQVTDVHETWTGNEGHFDLTIMGLPVSGDVQVRERDVLIDGKLPFAAIPFKSKIENTIREKAKTLLA